MGVVEFEGVSKAFGNVAAVNNVTFRVSRGEILSILGPSGCGKSTTLRLIAGFETPDSGVIRLAGKDVHGLRPYQRNVGLLFQDYALFPHMTVQENVSYGMHRRGMDRRRISTRSAEMLQLVKLTGYENSRPANLSGGQQQRVALARALSTSPEVILLDEPLSALDAKLRQELRIELREILTNVGTTAIVVTHDQEEAMSIADRIIVLNAGQVEQQGTALEIYARPASRFVADFIGRSNWFLGRLKGAVQPGLAAFVTDDGQQLFVRHEANGNGAVGSVCVRPERMRIERGACSPLQYTNRFPATVVNVAYLGADVHITLDGPGGRRFLAIVKNSGRPVAGIGETVSVAFDPDDCIALT
jgi:putative spermidine/putrescine transport system ATP-binding protein/putrescine transport system ATP-binding protein